MIWNLPTTEALVDQLKSAPTLRRLCGWDAERVNSNLKDNYGGRFVRMRGPAKVMCHLMFGLLVDPLTIANHQTIPD